MPYRSSVLRLLPFDDEDRRGLYCPAAWQNRLSADAGRFVQSGLTQSSNDPVSSCAKTF